MVKKIAVLILAVMAATLLLTACGSDDGDLIGSWVGGYIGDAYFQFNEDGTGMTHRSTIRWERSGNGRIILCLVHSPILCSNGCDLASEWTYSISGNVLSLYFRDSDTPARFTRR